VATRNAARFRSIAVSSTTRSNNLDTSHAHTKQTAASAAVAESNAATSVKALESSVQAATKEASVQEEESAASELRLKELVKQLQKVEASARSGGTALQQLCANDIADAEVC
jgi:hypothetical protein